MEPKFFSQFSVTVLFCVPAMVFFMALSNEARGEEVTAYLVPLGDLPGGDYDSAALDVSDDGSVVVGHSAVENGGREAFRWTKASGMVGLGDLPGGLPGSRAWGVSADGSVIVGQAAIEGPSTEAFKWTESTGMKGLGDLSGGDSRSDAIDVSGNGLVIVGEGESAAGPEAVRWVSGSGRSGLGDLEGGSFNSAAYAISPEGSVIVGSGTSELLGVSVSEAFRWTEDGGMVGLGDLSGGEFWSKANDVSSNGEAVVGWSFSELGHEAFIWTEHGGMVGLGSLDVSNFRSEARSVSADGQIVVGDSMGNDGMEAFIWSESTGMQKLEDVLQAQGANEVEGWGNLRSPRISSSGNWIVGRGENPSGDTEAFIARINSFQLRSFRITPGLNDAWFNPATSGQGFLITVFPEIRQVFLAWFTFDTERPSEDVTAMLGEPGHRWLTAQGPYDGDTANLTIFVTAGGVFDEAEPAASTDPAGDGTLTLEFADCTEGLVTYEITSLGISGEIPIQRIVPDNVPSCESNGSL